MYRKTVEEVQKELQTNLDEGLKASEALKRLETYGYNELKEHKFAEFVIINDNIIYKYILDEKDVCNGGKGGKKEK